MEKKHKQLLIDIGQVIFEERMRRQETLEHLANRLNMSRPNLTNYENGKLPMNIQTLIKILDGLELELRIVRPKRREIKKGEV